jgi:hypothetical protein
MILFLFLPLELLLGPDHDLTQYFISRALSLIVFNYQKSILLLLFYLKCARPDSVDKAVGLGQAATICLWTAYQCTQILSNV